MAVTRFLTTDALAAKIGGGAPPPTDVFTITLALIVTSQLGVGADDYTTVYTTPWFRASLFGAFSPGDVVRFQVDGIDTVSATLTVADIARGYVDVQMSAISASTVQVRATRVRNGVRGAYTANYPLTIKPLAFDGLSNVFAAHGTQRLLSSYSIASPLVRIVRPGDLVEHDMVSMVDGYVSVTEAVGFAQVGGATTVPLKTIYDQTGNGRSFTHATAGNQPTFSTVEWRAHIRFIQSGTDYVAGTSMGSFAQNQAAVSLSGAVNYTSYTLDAATSPVVQWASNNATSTRVGMGALGSGLVGAFGRILDADGNVATTGIAGVANTWTVQIARFSASEAKLYHNAYGASETKDPWQSAGSFSNTSSGVVNIGRQNAAGYLDGRAAGLGWHQEKLSDANVTALIAGQLDFTKLPAKPFIRAGVTTSIEAFRTAIINAVTTNAGLSTGGFTTNTLNTTDPLTALSLHPTNLLTYDGHTIDILNNVAGVAATLEVGVWKPTAATKNNRLVIMMAGHGTFSDELDPNVASHTHGNLVKELVVAGYTVCFIEMPGDGDTTAHNAYPAPTVTLNPLRYFVEGPTRAINALIGESYSRILTCGHSGGGWAVPLLMTMDTRIAAGVSCAGFLPLWMISIGGTGTRDYEQWLPGLYNLSTTQGCDYLDLVIGACSGGSSNRTMLQSLNDADPVAFSQTNYNTYKPYATQLATACALYGGTYSLTFDSNSVHNYSTARRAAIIALFNTF